MMVSDSFATFFSIQNHKVIKTTSSCWYDQGPGVYQAYPYHHIISPSDDELSRLFKEHKAFALRYSTEITESEGMLSYHVIWDQPIEEIQQFPKKVRNDIRKGLASAQYTKIALEELAGTGWEVRYDTLKRQNRTGAETREQWESMCLAAAGLEGFEAWAAITPEGQMAASMLCFVEGDTSSILYQQSMSQYLNLGVNNALAYTFMNHSMNEVGVRQIFYGLHSLDAPFSVDQFKFRMGFYPRPVRQRIVFHPLIRPFINRITRSILNGLSKIFPGSYHLSKAQGIVNFYLQGKKPINEQEMYATLQEYL